MSENAKSTRELAVLFSMVLKHPSMTPALQEGILGLFSDVDPLVDPYASPEGIELYLNAYARKEASRSAAAAV